MLFRWLVVLLFPMSLQAAPMETMAWHFAKMPELAAFYGNATSLPDPPAATTSPVSCFTGKDDKLKDLSEPFRKYFHLGPDSWLVWNESRKLLVGHAMPITLWQIEPESDFKGQPTQLATTITWYQGIEPGQPVPADAKPVHRMTLVSRSGQKATQLWGSSEPARLQSINLEVELVYGGNNYSDSSLDVDLRFTIDWSEASNGKTWKWNLTSSAVLESNPTRPLVLTQVVSPAGGSWTLTAETSILLFDGQPLANCRLKESNGKPVAATEYPKLIAPMQATRIPTSKGEVLFRVFPVSQLSKYLKANASGSKPGEEVDPFSASGVAPPSRSEQEAVITSIPEEFKPWFPQLLIDLKEPVKGFGINVPEGSLIGYDANSGWVFVAGLDATALEQLEILTLGCNLPAPAMIGILQALVTTQKSNQVDEAKAYLVGRNGQKFGLTCKVDANGSLIELEFEPTLGNTDQVVDLRLYSKRAAPFRECNTSISLPCGVSVMSHSDTAEDGKQVTESFQATIVRPPNEGKSTEAPNPSD